MLVFFFLLSVASTLQYAMSILQQHAFPSAHLESSVLSLPARGLLMSPIGPFRFLNKNLETQTAKSGIQSCHSERLSDYFQKAFDTPFVIVALTGSGGGVVNLKDTSTCMVSV